MRGEEIERAVAEHVGSGLAAKVIDRVSGTTIFARSLEQGARSWSTG